MKYVITIFLLLASLTCFAEIPPKDLSSPRSSMHYFLKSMKEFKKGNPLGLDAAIEVIDQSDFDEASKDYSAKLIAKKIINTLDRLEYVDIKAIPKAPKKDLWIFRRDILSVEGKAIEAEIAFKKNKKNQWLFSKKTNQTIASFEQSVINRKTVEGVIALSDFNEKIKRNMPAWTGDRSFILLNGQWLGIIVIIFVSLLLDKLVKIFIGQYLFSLLRKRKIKVPLEQKEKILFPIGVMTFSGFWTIAIRVLEIEDSILAILLRGGYIVFTTGTVLFAHRLVDYFCLFLEKKAIESENKFDDILVPLIRKTAKFFVVVIGLIFIGNSLTLNMKSIIAGMGIGGFAFALAAKDTIGNLFGSMTVLLDRPFRIGDWVVIDGKIEGVIEEVGMRSTRVRTFYNSLITVPNGTLTSVHIDNYGERRYRRFSTKINVEYSTSTDQIERFCEGIREIIKKMPSTRKDSFFVYFNGMSESSLDILVYMFFEVPDWSIELEEKHKFLIQIKKLAEDLKVNFAFPTRTLHLFNEGEENQNPT